MNPQEPDSPLPPGGDSTHSYAGARQRQPDGEGLALSIWSVDATAPLPAEGTAQTEDLGAQSKRPEVKPGTDPPYRLVRVVGRGGMGEVWSAVQTSLGRVVAVKRIRADRLSREDESYSASLVRQFHYEAATAARLEHPNIVPVHDIGVGEDGTPLLSMKLVTGQGWDRVLAKDFAALNVPDFLAKHLPLLVSMAQAVAFAHSRGIVHRDLKPAQVILGEFGEVLLTDWGLAIQVDGAWKDVGGEFELPKLITAETASAPSGTPALMAPEQTDRDPSRIGRHTDVYLLGGTLYYLLTGTYPHAAPTAAAAFEHARDGIIDPPQERAPTREIPQELEALCYRCLERDPARRTINAADFVAEVQEYLSGSGKRRESAELCATARAETAGANGAYAPLSNALSELLRARGLWPDNPEIPALEDETLDAFAAAATGNGDLVLARLQAERIGDARRRAAIVQRIDTAEREVVARERQRRVLRRVAFAALLVIVLGSGTFTSFLMKAQQAERAQRLAAEHARDEALRARLAAQEARGRAEDLMGFMIFDMRDSLRSIGKLSLLGKVSVKAEEYYAALDEAELSRKDRQLKGRTLLSLGDLRMLLGDTSSAERNYAGALGIWRELHRDYPEDPKIETELGLAILRTSYITERRNEQEATRELAEKALRHTKHSFEAAPDDPRVAENHTVALDIYGDALRDIDQAKYKAKIFEVYEESRSIRQDFAQREPERSEWRRLLAMSLDRLYHVADTQEQVLAMLQEATETREELLRLDPTSFRVREELCTGLANLISYHLGRKEYAQAYDHLPRTLKFLEEAIRNEPSNREFARNAVLLYSVLLGVCIELGRDDEATAIGEAAFALAYEWAWESPEFPGFAERLSMIADDRIKLWKRRGDPESAAAELQAMSARMNLLRDRSRDAPGAHWLFSIGIVEAFELSALFNELDDGTARLHALAELKENLWSLARSHDVPKQYCDIALQAALAIFEEEVNTNKDRAAAVDGFVEVADILCYIAGRSSNSTAFRSYQKMFDFVSQIDGVVKDKRVSRVLIQRLLDSHRRHLTNFDADNAGIQAYVDYASPSAAMVAAIETGMPDLMVEIAEEMKPRLIHNLRTLSQEHQDTMIGSAMILVQLGDFWTARALTLSRLNPPVADEDVLQLWEATETYSTPGREIRW